MRVQTNSKFAERPNEIMVEMPKYFLIYEGEVTEPMYFNGVIVNRKKLAIKQSISLISVLRSLDDSSKSHPKYALKMANDIKYQSTENVISKENLYKCIVDFIKNEDLFNKDELINMAKIYIENYANDLIDWCEIDNIIIDIYKDNVFHNIVSEIIGYDKSNLNFDLFVNKIDDAIKREKNYCENVEDLKEKIGSNIGILIENMRN